MRMNWVSWLRNSLDGKVWGEGTLTEKVFQGREIVWVEDVVVQESDINDHHDGVGRERGGEGLYNIVERSCD